MIVADANLLAYLVLPGERTKEAEAVFLTDPAWVAPVLWLSELRSVVGQYVRRGDLSTTQAIAALERADTVIAGREGAADSRAVLELSQRSKCSTYDCEYVVLAADLGVVLVTADGAVLRAFPKLAIAPSDFVMEGSA